MAKKTDPRLKAERMVGRCEMFDEIACGGMATIHLGRMLGAGDFRRTVAIKRLHPQFARDPEFANMFLDEARMVARVRHPNVVPTIDLVEEDGDLYIIMEFIEGLSFSDLMKRAKARGERVPPGVAIRVVHGALHGLHAAHDATDERGRPLGLVHRDVSPDNILVGIDGFPRVLDFGVARARNRLASTRDDRIKGKLAYMAPEQVMGEALDRRTDVFAASVVLWQALTGRRLFKAEHLVELAHKVLNMDFRAPSAVAPDLGKRWDAIVLRGLERPIPRRWRDALSMAEAIEAVGGMASHREVGLWVRRIGSDRLDDLAAQIRALETKPVGNPAEAKRRIHPRSQLHIDRAELAKAVRDAQRTADVSTTPIDEPKLVGPPAPEDTGEIVLPPPLPKRAAKADDPPSQEPPRAEPVTRSTTDTTAPTSQPEPKPIEKERLRAGASLPGLAQPEARGQRGRRRSLWIGSAVGLAVLGALGLGLGLRDPNRADNAAPAATAEPTTTSTASAAAIGTASATDEPATAATATPSSSPSPDDATATDAGAAAATATATTTASAVPSSAPQPTSKRRPPPPPPPATTSPPTGLYGRR